MLLVLRASGTRSIGSGHVMRCAALAEAWLASGLGEPVLWGDVTVPFVLARLARLGIRQTASAPVPSGAAVLVCDDYGVAERGDSGQRPGYAVRALVDDLGGPVPPGFDTLWNPNACSRASMYPGFTGTLLVGPEFVPMRADLPRWRGDTRGPVAIMCGASRLGPVLTEALRRFGEGIGSERVRVAGAWAPAGWPRLAEEDPWPGIAGASVLVTSSGATTWEAAGVGVPVVALRIAANQDLIFRWAVDAGAPGVDGLDRRDAEAMAAELGRATTKARPLPAIRNGAPAVARRLAALARAREHGA